MEGVVYSCPPNTKLVVLFRMEALPIRGFCLQSLVVSTRKVGIHENGGGNTVVERGGAVVRQGEA